MPTELSAAFSMVTLLFTSVFTLISGILFPSTPTPVSVIADFSLLFPLVLVGLTFIRRLSRGTSD